jgi:hypothetical protein
MPSNSAISANGAVRTGQLTQVSTMANTDTFVITIFSANSNGETRAVSLNSVANAFPITKVQSGSFVNSTANTTVLGSRLFFDADYLYVAVANGSVKRIALSAF